MANDAAYLNAIPAALIAVDRELCVKFVNQAAEMLFGISAPSAKDRPLLEMHAFDPELATLCQRVLESGEEMTLFEHQLHLLQENVSITLHISPVETTPGQLLITLEKTEGLSRLSANSEKQEATRAAGVMAAMLAHEVKNPLSGIRGAAQLLKEEVSSEHQALAELICMETDRIRDLLAQVEVFSSEVPSKMQPVNIHEALQYVIAIAKNGFAKHVTFKELYDPSLPDVLAQRDVLVQLLLNLVKNAAEAQNDQPDATITLSTHYVSGYRIRQPGNDEPVALPIAVTIADNGPGIDEAMRAHLFEPFVSSKQEGRGLGLAVVAKIASDLGAVVELEKDTPKGAAFRVMLRVAG